MKNIHDCRNLSDFKKFWTDNKHLDSQEFLAEASTLLNESDMGLLEIHVGD